MGVQDRGEVSTEFFGAGLVVALDGGLLERPVNRLDLAVRPRVVAFGHLMLDLVLGACEFEGVGAEDLAAVHRLANRPRGGGGVAGRG